jgi:uncharacterized membrane protein YphA (DoxX/SURF4 family)
MDDRTSRAGAVFFARVLLGIIFLMQGYGKIFTFTVPKVYHMFFTGFQKTFLPEWLLWATAYYTSYIELFGGALLIAGFRSRWALFLLGIDLLVVSFGHGLMEPIWDLQHVIPRAILLIAVLLLPKAWDRWSLDSLLAK